MYQEKAENGYEILVGFGNRRSAVGDADNRIVYESTRGGQQGYDECLTWLHAHGLRLLAER